MRWDPNDAAGRQSRPHTMADALKRLRHLRARAAFRPAGQRETANVLASFGMIVSLLLVWAMAATM